MLHWCLSPNLGVRDNFPQNDTDAAVAAGVPTGNVHLLFSVTVSVLDSKVGQQLGITNANLDDTIILHRLSLARTRPNVNSLGITINTSGDTRSNKIIPTGTSLSNAVTSSNSLGTTVGTSTTNLQQRDYLLPSGIADNTSETLL